MTAMTTDAQQELDAAREVPDVREAHGPEDAPARPPQEPHAVEGQVVMAGDDDMQEDDEFGPWCPDIGQEHAWSEWEFSMVGSHECRFCSKCGGMETQEICTDPNCAGDHPHG